MWLIQLSGRELVGPHQPLLNVAYMTPQTQGLQGHMCNMELVAVSEHQKAALPASPPPLPFGHV